MHMFTVPWNGHFTSETFLYLILNGQDKILFIPDIIWYKQDLTLPVCPLVLTLHTYIHGYIHINIHTYKYIQTDILMDA